MSDLDMSDLDALSEDELRQLKREKYLIVELAREQMLAIERVFSDKRVARKAEERRIAENTPGAVMAQIEATAAEADAGGEAP